MPSPSLLIVSIAHKACATVRGHALCAARQVWCVFVFDRDILDPLIQMGQTADRRVEFIVGSLVELDENLRQLGRQAGRQEGRGRRDIFAKTQTDSVAELVRLVIDAEPEAPKAKTTCSASARRLTKSPGPA